MKTSFESRNILSAMIEVPRPQGGQPHVLLRRDTDCPEDDVVSTPNLEFSGPHDGWCEQTTRNTSRNILCWVRSVKPLSSSPEPFQLVRQPRSTRKYQYLHKKLLTFVLRAYRLDPVLRRRLTKIQLSTKFLRLLDRLSRNQSWDCDGQRARDARTSAVSSDLIDLSPDAEANGIDHTNGHGSNVENDDEYDDGSD
ncbi:hypothetical protein MGU_11167 [Metarhizium guizhouense ARSEF 977]|uniref:Uncharacterized protein n=1 Tax=Metarhizium guizhouense (strain ARSEF 977) TaxID=1276136 RepID=A0A0B4HPW6_METGA|nr:hypothetical protein MGU_11167 [Metarhizium guizhouense ARSEF 977]